MNKITISTGHPDAGRIYAEAYDAALAREAVLREELATIRADRDAEKKMKAKARDQRDVQTIRACELQQRLTVAEQQLGIQDRFAGYLLDHCEGEVIYEESLQYWLSESIKLHAESLKPAAEEGALGARPVGCCCPPIGHAGIWAAAICPVHFGLRRPKPSAEGEGS